MSGNMDLWHRLGKTDPSQTKTFKRAGGFSGTAIKPMWAFKRMTETFGPAGTGWGNTEPVFQIVAGDNKEMMVYCTAGVWYRESEKDASRTVFGVGGDKIVTHIKANEQYNRPERWENDDEAFKKAFTDAITNAMKLIGVGADVHMGLFDDSKYVETRRQEEARAKDEAEAHVLGGDMETLINSITDAVSYAKARDAITPLFKRLKAIDPEIAKSYEAAMIGLKAKYAGAA